MLFSTGGGRVARRVTSPGRRTRRLTGRGHLPPGGDAVARRLRKQVAKRRVSRRPTQSARRTSQIVSRPPKRLHNLPTQLTTFIGREREIAEVTHLLSGTHLLTLTGPGGCGKSRLALRVASGLLQDYADGVWLAQLAPVSDPAFVPQTIAAALRVLEQPGRPVIETLVDALRFESLLLVMDNCEHLLSACAGLADALLQACSGLRVLATSQEPLGVPGETIWRVPSLSVPDEGRVPTVNQLVSCEAVRLFVERAASARPGFTPTDSTAPVVAQICRQVDGIPLAIELAAARVKALAVEQIAARLDDRFRLLTGGSRTALPRHQTLRETMDWSYELLSQTERIMLHRLSVFAGGCSLEAAETVCSGSGILRHEVLELLTRLTDKSLVVVDTQSEEARYRLLETVRQYGRDRLEETEETADVRRRHFEWHLGLAERAESELRGPTQGDWLKRLEAEHDNLRASLKWAKTETGKAEARLRLAGALYRFWLLHGDWSEGRGWLEGALSAIDDAPTTVLPKALRGAAQLAWRQGDDGRATAFAEKGLAASCELGDRDEIAWHHLTLGTTLLQNDTDRAEELLRHALALSRELGDNWRVSVALAYLGVVARYRRDHQQAAAHYKNGLAVSRAVGDKWLIAHILRGLGTSTLHLQDYRRAASSFAESLALSQELGNRWGTEECLEGFACMASAHGQHERAARLFGAAEALRETLGFHRLSPDQADYEQRLATTHARLEDAVFTTAYGEGRALTLEQAFVYALASGSNAEHRSVGTSKLKAHEQQSVLTPREREVAVLIARGLTNREIGGALVIAEKTADAHVQHILNRLGFHSRAQIAAWAVEHGL